MPPQVSYTTQVPLSSTTTNVLLGTVLQTAPGRGVIQILGRHAAAQGTLVMNVWRGADQVAFDTPMQAAAGGPNTLEDSLASFAVFGGETLMVKLTEKDGTATDPSMRFEFFPR